MPGSARALVGISVIVADDHEDSVELFEMLLAHHGAMVRISRTGEEALTQLQSFRPQVLLLDITLPDMDGYALLQRIRALPGCEEIPAVAVTGLASEQDKARSRAAGFAEHVMKPVDSAALVTLLAALAGAQAARSAIVDAPVR